MTWTFTPIAPTSPVAEILLREYYLDIVGRYWGRPATDDEVARVLRKEPSDDLVPPRGLFLAGYFNGELAGCGGFRVLSPGVAEMTRVFLRVSMRGCGGGAALLTALERASVDAGLSTIRLDTREDLIEARRLYTRHGYLEIPAYNDSPYADHWFEKQLRR